MNDEKESMDHKPFVEETGNAKYPYIAKCTCPWQGLAKTRDQAEAYKRRHEANSLMLKATKGWQFGH